MAVYFLAKALHLYGLLDRARYEIANNAYAKGLVLTLAATCIGTGPRLQLLSDDEGFNTIVETEFVAGLKPFDYRNDSKRSAWQRLPTEKPLPRFCGIRD